MFTYSLQSTFLLLIFHISIVNAQSIPKKVRLPELLNEASGMVIIPNQTIYWLNDSGDQANLYQTDVRGNLLEILPIADAVNRDWEDMTIDEDGTIYIGDFGNNGNQRQDLTIYKYRPNQSLDSIRFAYPDQNTFPPKDKKDWSYDMEGFFWHNHQLHLFSKNKLNAGNYYTKHYILKSNQVKQTAILKDSLYLKNRVVTSAAISPDKQTVALLTYDFRRILGFIPKSSTSIIVFSDFEGDDFLKGRQKRLWLPHLLMASQYEAIDFIDNNTVLVATEKTIMTKQKFKRKKIK